MLVGDEVVERLWVLVLSELIEIIAVSPTEIGRVERLEAEPLGLDTRMVNGPATLAPVMPVVAVETSPDDMLAAPVFASIVGVAVELSLSVIRHNRIDVIERHVGGIQGSYTLHTLLALPIPNPRPIPSPAAISNVKRTKTIQKARNPKPHILSRSALLSFSSFCCNIRALVPGGTVGGRGEPITASFPSALGMGPGGGGGGLGGPSPTRYASALLDDDCSWMGLIGICHLFLSAKLSVADRSWSTEFLS